MWVLASQLLQSCWCCLHGSIAGLSAGSGKAELCTREWRTVCCPQSGSHPELNAPLGRDAAPAQGTKGCKSVEEWLWLQTSRWRLSMHISSAVMCLSSDLDIWLVMEFNGGFSAQCANWIVLLYNYIGLPHLVMCVSLANFATCIHAIQSFPKPMIK